ncbi:hypothetical protein AMS68_005301 [Peltaster fructicola]|uniref:Chitin-binding type-1 domain-containing protein n=1 Tax=Peltaster fructicola TaxID=286661 RepID=A0A6H0XYG6_9PEZI|nr:hypothetical protein AMS68_005301 [Peltaster fructicola]
MLDHSGWTWPIRSPSKPPRDSSQFWHSGTGKLEDWSGEERKRRTIPDYVLEYAPYVHLFSGETYWPSDIAEHLVHTRPILNHSAIDYGSSDTHDLNNLGQWNSLDEDESGSHVFLHSYDNIEVLPDWLRSEHNIPASLERQGAYDYDLPKSVDGRCGGTNATTCQGTSFGQCCSIFGWCGSDGEHCSVNCDPRFGHCHGPHLPGRYEPHTDLRKRDLFDKGRSTAPAILVLVAKADDIIDAFWFFFYSHNKGKKVLNIQFGNHVGDWEHTMIRFQNGTPTAAFLSAHSWGASFTYDALEKYALDPQTGELLSSDRNTTSTAPEQFKRPIVFSAEGSHAMYATPDYHDYVAPYGILHDDTDRGPLWDPLKNLKAFTYDIDAGMVRSSTLNPDAPTSWFDFAGHWGDRYYLLSDPRQYRFAGEYHYVSGPSGPKFKNLGRDEPCERQGPCKVATTIQRVEAGGMIHM